MKPTTIVEALENVQHVFKAGVELIKAGAVDGTPDHIDGRLQSLEAAVEVIDIMIEDYNGL